MAVDFSAFDKKVDLDALQEEVKNADLSSFEDVPDGTYIVGFDKMEIKPTKAKDKLMFAVQCKIKEGPHKGRLLFFNRVISGNKTSEKWNDIFQEVQGKVEAEVDWAAKDFNPITINEVFDC